MFIIFGTRETKKVKAEKQGYCNICQNSTIAYVRTITWFSLFFIPIIPLFFRYSKICTRCGNETIISKKQFNEEINDTNELPPPPVSDVEIIDVEEGEREITIIRKKKIYGSMMKMKCYIDNKEVATLKNGQQTTFNIENRECRLYAKFNSVNGNDTSNVIILKPTDTNNTFYVTFKGQGIVLSDKEIK